MSRNTGHPRLLAMRIASLFTVGAVLAACGGDAPEPGSAPTTSAVAPAPLDPRLAPLFDGNIPPTNPLTPSPPLPPELATPPNPGTPTDPGTPIDPEDPEPLPADPGPTTPSADQRACTGDAQFQLAEGWNDPNGLVNRHVLCVKQQIKDEIDVKNPDGILIHNSGVVTLDTRWSVHGAHNKLEKSATLSLKYSYAKQNELAAPTLRVVAKIACSEVSGSVPMNCGKDMAFTLQPGGASEQTVTLPFSWDTTKGEIAKAYIGVKLLYTTDGSTPFETEDGSNGTTVEEMDFASWELRCDVNQLRAKWKGCVFPSAAAVWNPVKDPSTAQARGHIDDVFKTMTHIEGRFMMKPGQRSVAMTGGQFAPLVRTNHTTKMANRAAAVARCAKLWPGASGDCDEYPPASSKQGATSVPGSVDHYSVRKILASDNQKAGSQMGAMFAKERVLENDEFWIKVD